MFAPEDSGRVVFGWTIRTPEVTSSRARVLAQVRAPEGRPSRARLTGAGLGPIRNGPESFGPRLVKPKGRQFALMAWASR